MVNFEKMPVKEFVCFLSTNKLCIKGLGNGLIETLPQGEEERGE